MTGVPFERAVDSIASLAEPVRRQLYGYVCQRDVPVGREEVAEATGIAHHTVKFHLDRLAADGLLEVGYQRLGDRTGPGAGRPAKVYQRVEHEVSVSLPAREYALAGALLAAAVETAAESGQPVLEALADVAAEHGREWAGQVGEPVLERVLDVLAAHGFQPREEKDRITLCNCPFHALAQQHTPLVCGMNHALLAAFTAELAPTCLVADLEPEVGRCCVVLSRR